MERQIRMRGFVGLAAFAITAGALLAAPEAQTPAPDPGDMAEGIRLYQQKGDCRACHGWAADGGKATARCPTARACATRNTRAIC